MATVLQTETVVTTAAEAATAAALKSPPQPAAAAPKRSNSSGKAAAKSPGSPSKAHPNEVDPTFDPSVVPAVRSIVHLLQIYGPLSYEQLKFNMNPQLVCYHAPNPALPTLPPLKPGEKPPLMSDIAAKSRAERDRLQRVLDVLHELGVIHVVDKTKLAPAVAGKSWGPEVAKAASTVAANDERPPKEGSGDDETAPAQGKPAVEDDPNPIYCFGDGLPRMDVVQPSRVLDEIRSAGEEVQRATKRIEILKKALKVADDAEEAQALAVKDATTAETEASATESPGKSQPKRRRKPKGMTPQHALKKLLHTHPEIVQDPVYAAALRMFKFPLPSASNLDEAAVNRNGTVVDNTPEMERIIAAGLQFHMSGVSGSGGRKGVGGSRKRVPETSPLDVGTSGSGTGSGSKKKRKKARTSKSASFESLQGNGGGATGGE